MELPHQPMQNVMLQRLWSTVKQPRLRLPLLSLVSLSVALIPRAFVATMAKDPSSFANVHAIASKHWNLQLYVDFEQKMLHGSVETTVEALIDGVNDVILDIRALHIENVTTIGAAGGGPLEYEIGEEQGTLGAPLRVRLPAPLNKGELGVFRVEYATMSSGSALQFLPPEQTNGNKYPYLFSQCQSVHARSLFPCADTPMHKATYSASIALNKEMPLTALMSAFSKGQKQMENQVEYAFEQPIPIPSYLVTLIVGHIESRDLSPRCRVWSEPGVVDKAAYEFKEVEKYLMAAEDLLGEYVWGRYDMVVLPNSFPYGGMENPQLTFVTPTLLAGDRSLVGVVAHEIAHSWTGNLVSPKNWEHFWLNEGFTVFVERKIMEKVTGSRQVADLHAIIGWEHLKEDVERYGEDHPFTALIPRLEDGVDPDDAFSSVPYEKGSAFLRHLEQMVGVASMNAFLRAWVVQFGQHAPIESSDFQSFVLQHFADHKNVGALQALDWKTWLSGPGMPPRPVYDNALAVVALHAAQQWAEGQEGCTRKEWDVFNCDQLQVLLDAMLNTTVSLDVVRKMQAVLSVDTMTNAEIQFRWLSLRMHANDVDAIEAVCVFLREQGRMKFVRPLYRRLAKMDAKVAKQLFKEYGHRLHAIAYKMVAADLMQFS